MADSHHRGDIGPLGRLAGSLRDRMLDVVGPDEIVERLDVNAVLDRVDIETALARVDIDRLLARLTSMRSSTRVDINRLLDRVDVDAVMDRVDVERLVQRAGIPDTVAESTGSVAETALDMLRRQLLGLDVALTRAIMRILSRDEHSLPVPWCAVRRVCGGVAGHLVVQHGRGRVHAGDGDRRAARCGPLRRAGFRAARIPAGAGAAAGPSHCSASGCWASSSTASAGRCTT
jgi:hypothetical protein